jgi:hypothetical protein
LPRTGSIADEIGMSRPFSADSAPATWSPTARCVVSVLILLHLTAVFVAPFAFACTTAGASSPFADGLMYVFRPYLDALYLNHGYSFFAPNPGPSHLVRYRVDFNDGRPSVEGVFPDLKTHRPRLLYHRHFMLAEQLHNLYTPADPPPEMPLDPNLARTLTDPQRREMTQAIRQRQRLYQRNWEHSRELYLSLRHSLSEHLQSLHGGDNVSLTRVEHQLLVPGEFQVIRRLDAPHTYVNLPEGAPAPEVLRPESQSQP